MCQHEDGLFRGRELVPRQLGTASASLGLTFPTSKTQEKHPVLYHGGLQVTQSENLWLARKISGDHIHQSLSPDPAYTALWFRSFSKYN
jgi:hypothetical protein